MTRCDLKTIHSLTPPIPPASASLLMPHRLQPSIRSFITNPYFVFSGAAGLVFGVGSLILIGIALSRSEPQRVAETPADPQTVIDVAAVASETESSSVSVEDKPMPAAPNEGVHSESKLAPDQQLAAAESRPAGKTEAIDNPLAGEPFAPFFKCSLPQREFTDEDRRTYVDDKYVPRYSYATESGTLAIVGPWKREIGFVTNDAMEQGGSEESVQLVTLSGDVTGVDYKPRPNGGKFLVSYQNPAGIAFIDATTLELQKKISLPDEQGPNVTCPKDPHVDFAFAFAARGNSYQINVDTMEIAQTWPICTGPGHATYDGTWVVRNWRGPISVQMADQRGWSHVEHGVTKYDHSAPTPLVDPLGRFVALRNEIYSSDFAIQLGEFETAPEAVSVDNSWMFGIEKTELILASLNDGKTIKRFALPNSWIPLDGIADHHRTPSGIETHLRRIRSRRGSSNAFTRWSDVFRCQLIADDQRERLLIAGADLLSIPYAAFDLPPEPRLLLDNIPFASGTIGDAIEFDVPLGTEDVTVELVDTKGATIEGNRFRWTPQAGQSGKQTFVAKIKKGNASHLTSWNIQVDRRTTQTLPIDFFADGVTVSSDATMIAIRGHQRAEKTVDQELRTRAQTAEIAVFDLRSKELKVGKSIAGSLSQLEFCQNELLVCRPKDRDSQTVARLRLPNLTLAGETDLGKGRLVSIGDKVVGLSDSDRWAYYTVPDLKPLGPQNSNRLNTDKLSGRRVADGWTYDGVLWGTEMKTPQLIYRSGPFASLGSGLTTRHGGAKITQQIYQGFVYDLPTTVNVSRQGWRDKTSYDSFYLPADITVEVSRDSCDLVFRSIDDKVEQHRLLLMPRPNTVSSDSRMQDIAFTKDNLYVVFAGQVFVVDVQPLVAMMPRPFHIAPVQSTMVLKGRTPTVNYDAPGATSFKLELIAFQGGANVTLESSDGKFTIDMSHINEIAAEAWTKMPTVRGGSNDAKTRLQTYLKYAKVAYQKITSRNPSGVPIAVTAVVSATGPGLATDVLAHVYLIDVPQTTMRKNMPADPAGGRTR